MNSSAGTGLLPGLSESNTQIVIKLRQKSTQEACQGESWTKKRAEAATDEGETERDVDVFGLSSLECSSLCIAPSTTSLS